MVNVVSGIRASVGDNPRPQLEGKPSNNEGA